MSFIDEAYSSLSSLAGGAGSALSSLGNTAVGAASNVLSASSNLGAATGSYLSNAGSSTGGYLSSLSQQPTSFINNNASPAFSSLGSSFNSLGSSVSSLPSFVSSNFNMGSLTSGLSNLNAPNVVGAASSALNNYGGALNSFVGGSPSSNLQQTLQNKFNDMVASKPQQNFGSPSPIASPQDNVMGSLNFGNMFTPQQPKQDYTYKEQSPISTIIGAVSQGRLPTTNEFLAPSSPVRQITGGYVPEKETSLSELMTPQRGTEGLLNTMAFVPGM